jgi:hypothetical protein
MYTIYHCQIILLAFLVPFMAVDFMSLLRQLPEFVRGETLARSGKWTAARTEFLRCTDVMKHANSTKDESIASLFAASCSYFHGDFEESRKSFNRIVSQSSGLENDPVKMQASRYMFATNLMAAQSTSEIQSIIYRARGAADMWTHLAVDVEPPVGSYARTVHEFIHSDGEKSLTSPSNSTERLAYAHALITVAGSSIAKLPEANVDNINISDQVESVKVALKSAEAIAEGGKADLAILSKFYIARALLLRGRLFEFNANALMAEGMYRAAAEQTESRLAPRLTAINRIAKRSLGDLLSKWERREREGEELKEENKPSEVDLKLSTIFLLEPTFDELGQSL